MFPAQYLQALKNYTSSQPSPSSYRRKLVPTTMPKGTYVKQGIHRTSRTAGRRLKARISTQRNVLDNIAKNLCPVITLEENFTTAQFIPDPTSTTGDGTSGAFAPPMVNGEIGSVMHQLVSPYETTVSYTINGVPTNFNVGGANVSVNAIPYPNINSGVGSQLVQWQAQYLRPEQDILLQAGLKGRISDSSATLQYNHLSNPAVLTTAGLNASLGVPAKDFVYKGGTTYHTFMNTGTTQCSFTLMEFQPRRFGNITPQEAWDYDLQKDHSSLISPAHKPANLAIGVGQVLRNSTKLGMRPGQLKGGMFNYWFKQLSAKTFHMEPGEELKYKQIFPPWVDRAKMRDIYLSRNDPLNGQGSYYNTRTRYLLFIGYGETTKFTGTTAATVDLGKIGAFKGSWSMAHNMYRKSVIQCLLYNNTHQKHIVDNPDTFTSSVAGTTWTEQDINEPNDTQALVGI